MPHVKQILISAVIASIVVIAFGKVSFLSNLAKPSA